MTTQTTSNQEFNKHNDIPASCQTDETSRNLDINKQIGMKIKLYRRMLGLSQKELGQNLTKPISAQQLQKYENGTNNISMKILLDIARVLGISLDVLLVFNADGNVQNNTQDYVSRLVSNTKFYNRSNVDYLEEIAKVLSKVESISLKDKIVEMVRMMTA